MPPSKNMPRPEIPLNRELLEARIGYIEESLKSLERFQRVTRETFLSDPDNFRIAFYDLHRALEAVMDIGSPILSRIPGGRPSSYKDIPRCLRCLFYRLRSSAWGAAVDLGWRPEKGRSKIRRPNYGGLKCKFIRIRKPGKNWLGSWTGLNPPERSLFDERMGGSLP